VHHCGSSDSPVKSGIEDGAARSKDAGRAGRAKVKEHNVCGKLDLENGIMVNRTSSQKQQSKNIAMGGWRYSVAGRLLGKITAGWLGNRSMDTPRLFESRLL